MPKYIIIILVSSLTMLSCKNTSQTKEQNPKWDKIMLRMDLQSIDLYSDKDTIYSNTWRYQDSMAESGAIWHLQTKEKKHSIFLDSATKDSIYAIVMDIIRHPVFTKPSVSCYAGNISICVQSDHTQLCCKYASVGNWTTVSASTQKLYDILHKKIYVSAQ